MKANIYILIDPITDEVRYVGKTKYDRGRLAHHMYDASKCKFPVNKWILSLKNKGLKPEILLLDEINNDEEWKFWEQWYIQLFKSWGFSLTNISIGGPGSQGVIPSKELIEQRANKKRGIPLSDDHKKKISKANKGRIFSREAIEHFSEAAKKRKITPECRAKMVAARVANNNYKKSEETKKKISEKMKIIRNEQRLCN